jgi:hypothetical protein
VPRPSAERRRGARVARECRAQTNGIAPKSIGVAESWIFPWSAQAPSLRMAKLYTTQVALKNKPACDRDQIPNRRQKSGEQTEIEHCFDISYRIFVLSAFHVVQRPPALCQETERSI